MLTIARLTSFFSFTFLSHSLATLSNASFKNMKITAERSSDDSQFDVQLNVLLEPSLSTTRFAVSHTRSETGVTPAETK